MMSDIIEIIVKIFFGLVVFVAFFPIIWLLSTPFIFIGALFVSGGYRSNIKKDTRPFQEHAWIGLSASYLRLRWKILLADHAMK